MLGDVLVRLRQETEDYQGLKNTRCPWLRNLRMALVLRNVFSYTVFWFILFDWETLCVFAEWTPASPAKSIVSQI